MLTPSLLRKSIAGCIATALLGGTTLPAFSANDAYRPPASEYDGGADVYQPDVQSRTDDIYQPVPEDPYGADTRGGAPAGDSFGGSRTAVPEPGGYGEPYRAPDGDGMPVPKSPEQAGVYEQNEILSTGHEFFGSISQGLAKGVEFVFKSQGRPNGYILGEDAGGALVVGLRYGEGMLFTKNVGNHKVFWQGPTVGYDAGAEGSKAMILVYNMREPNDIYERFGGVQGAAYLVGGVSVQVQKHGHVTLAVIRSGVGLRLGANVGYMKYTRSPTWNPL